MADGMVTRELNCSDRVNVINAVILYCSAKERSTFTWLVKVDKVKRLLGVEALSEFQDSLDYLLNQRKVSYGKKIDAVNKGLLPLDTLKQDLPRLTLEERRGHKSTHEIPSSLDVFIQESLKQMHWNPEFSELGLDTCNAFGVSDG